jgi:hypothetical protein
MHTPFHSTARRLQSGLIVLCGLFAAGLPAAAQTGVGLVLNSGPTHTFAQTTVGTTTTFSVTLTNNVATTQTAYFGGLAAPFSLAAAAPVSVAAGGSTTLTVQFSPTTTGTFTDTLTVVGNIFGQASLIVTGQGIQVDLDYTATSLAFPSTALGATSTATVTVLNVGDGTALLSAPSFSHPAFSLDAGASTLTIPEGESGTLTFVFAPTAAGSYSESVTIASNDPTNPSVTLTLTATAVSEVSGEVCNTVWTLANSPYTLVDNVTVPAGCTLTIEPGVVVNLEGNGIQVNGGFNALGTATSPITLLDGPLNFGPGAPQSISYLNVQSESTFNSPYEILYFNNFESTTNQYDFDCYDYGSLNSYTGTSTGGNHGCSSWYRAYDPSYSSTRIANEYHVLHWNSSNYDGHLVLSQPMISANGGTYEISFRSVFIMFLIIFVHLYAVNKLNRMVFEVW